MERLRRRIGQNGLCPFCGLSDEDLIHVLRDCPAASEVWKHVFPVELQSMFFTGDLKEWLEMKLCSSIWLPKAKQYSLSHSGRLTRHFKTSHDFPMTGNWIQLCTDGSVKVNTGTCSMFDAELWGILDGLILIQEKGHHKVVIYSDNLEVFEVIPEDLPIDLVIDGLVNFRLC
ncbi:hypothetical protein Gogos_000608 [Gossypium gossypioides]|uniref:RNase H type-1 domain-containing protein n=1 Tax=Gossypium gossypioides TaxID=34282 RepID=A0A7J9CTD4_GOSGO|nr:hypothetical protein [Gossypium gossypioides]